MKIIQMGQIPSTVKRVMCVSCRTVFEYGRGDVTYDQRDGDFVYCPVCKTAIADSLGKLVGGEKA